MTEVKYIIISETAKNIVITHEILHKLNIILEDFIFPLLINNTGAITISESEKVTRNARHIDIHYHHIRDLIEKKIIEVSHIPTGEMAADGLTKALLSNKFKEFIKLVRVSKIETGGGGNGESGNGEASNGESNNGKASGNDKNDGNLVTNYYKEAGEEEVSFKAEEAG